MCFKTYFPVRNLTFHTFLPDAIFQYSLKTGICVFRPSAPALNLYFLAPGPNLYLPAPAFNLFLPVLVLTLCLPVLRFTDKVCYSYSVYLYKLSVYLYVVVSQV